MFSSRILTLLPLPNNATAVSVLGDGNCWFRAVLVALGISARVFIHEVNHMLLRRSVVALAISSDLEEWEFEGTQPDPAHKQIDDNDPRARWIRVHSTCGSHADQLVQQYTAILIGVTIRVRVGDRVDLYNPGCDHSIDIVMAMNGGVYNHFDVWTTNNEAQVRSALRAFDSEATHVGQAAFLAAIAGMRAPARAQSDVERAIAESMKTARAEQSRKDAEYARRLVAMEEQSRKDAEYARRLVAMEEQSRKDAEYARSLAVQA